jgi:hypothetical protein
MEFRVSIDVPNLEHSEFKLTQDVTEANRVYEQYLADAKANAKATGDNLWSVEMVICLRSEVGSDDDEAEAPPS